MLTKTVYVTFDEFEFDCEGEAQEHEKLLFLEWLDDEAGGMKAYMATLTEFDNATRENKRDEAADLFFDYFKFLRR